VDGLLDDLLELSEGPAPAAIPPDEPELEPEPDVDEAQAEQLFDSLLLEIQSSEPARPVQRDVAQEDLGGVERIPVLATPGETESRKLPALSGRLLDLVILGSVVGLILVFLDFRMWMNPFDMSNPLPIAAFAGVAAGGMAAGILLFHVSNGAVAQGDRLVKQGRHQEALAQYDRAIRMVRRPSYAWTSRGVALKYLGRLDEALRCHENAIRLDPENSVAWTNLGNVYFKKGELGKALECFEKTIKLQPKYAIAWNNKGVVLARMGRFQDADACHERATKLRPEYVAAWLNRGEVLARLGAREEAQRCLERARSISRGASA
jgi:Flp pilus assembly protein TadD